MNEIERVGEADRARERGGKRGITQRVRRG